MQLRVTVLGPQGRAQPATADATVSAPPDTPLAAVVAALSDAVTPGAGTPSAVFCGAERLDPETALLGAAPLVDGAVLALRRPVEAATEGFTARLLVVAGPDAGGVHLLRDGEVLIGRSAQADIPLDDPDVSRRHCVVTVAPDGALTVRDCGSTNGTTVDGAVVGERPGPLPEGADLRVGESVLRVVAARAVPAPRAAAVAPPERPGGLHLPGARTAGSDAGRGAARDATGPAPRGAGPTGPTTSGRGTGRGRSHTPAAAPPDPATLLLAAVEVAAPLWERGGGHPELLAPRLGSAQHTDGPLDPVTLRLAAAGSLGLAGPLPRVRSVARALLAQLVALHPPGVVEVVTIAPGCADSWAWTGWLPHTRPTTQPCHRLLAFDESQARARVAELLGRLRDGDRTAPEGAAPPRLPAQARQSAAEPCRGTAGPTGTATGRRTVVVVDGEVTDERLRRELARLAAEGPAAGIHLICLAQAPPSTPASPVTRTLASAADRSPAFAACGLRAVLSGEVATSVRLIGPDGRAGAPATADGVSAAWAERLARALAPLREAVGSEAELTALPESARLLDVLRLPRVTPAALRERWTAGGLPLVLGAAVGGPLATDLVAAAGPVVVEGPARSGRTELLCSLATSLAAAAGPDSLSLLLIDGADEGLAPCAELPQVVDRLRTTDPVRMRTVAQSLRAELTRRAHLLGGPSPVTWQEDDPTTALLRVVGQRRAGEEEPPRAAAPPGGDGPLPHLVVVVDDMAALRAPALGAPGRPAAGSVVRVLEAVVRDGAALGVHLVSVGEAAPAPEALRIRLTGSPAGRAELVTPEGPLAFQVGRVTGRIPRTATLRPSVEPLDWARAGDAPARRTVRELGNGPTDVALLASAAARAAQGSATPAASPA
ncbi:FHA domain-containing protein [Streptomyces bohaiensis]|uniref:FHA domain-containing protein n=1 Tax=Streptomyces bohaiensis TaxID=1431344 RepID=UPI003B7617CA